MAVKQRITQEKSPQAVLGRPEWDYLALAFGISWVGALCLALPWLVRGHTVPKFTGLMMFPVMLLGPSLAGIFMTWRTGGKLGLAALFRSMRLHALCSCVGDRPVAPAGGGVDRSGSAAQRSRSSVCSSLFRRWVRIRSRRGFVEEIGWTGFAFPSLAKHRTAFRAAVQLGVIWALWHAPVIDYLGTATPHGRWWLAYFLAFAGVLTAVRVLIAYLYVNTRSLLLVQMMHAASTGALVVLSPPGVSAGQEAFWYACYAAVLWLAVIGVRRVTGPSLTLQRGALDTSAQAKDTSASRVANSGGSR